MANLDPKLTELLEAFLDEQLTSDKREEALRMLESNQKFAEQARLQERIDAWTLRLFTPPPNLDIVPAELKQDESQVTLPADSNSSSRRRKIVVLAIAASIAWIAVAINVFAPRGKQIVFQPKPLTEVYQLCIEEGFEPYWVCDNDFLFAATFQRRQHVALKLAELPEGIRMVGLSYLAGISRKSTSMLAMVDDQSVIVFVDQAERDWKPETGAFADVGLNVFRVEKFGLVLYEVSPLERAVVSDYLIRSEVETNID